MSNDRADYTLKILTIGESAVGKTCILLRFTDNKFLVNHITTIGIDYKSKTIKMGLKTVKLKIWDTAGQERFRNITKQYYKGADGILLVYDITDRNSFEKIKDWMKQIQENTQKEQIGIVLLGNKCDLEDRQVSYEEGESLAKEYGLLFWETSAYKDKNISESFEGLTNLIISKKVPDEQNPERRPVIITDPDKDKKKGCC
jgi:small GTP-binding protein